MAITCMRCAKRIFSTVNQIRRSISTYKGLKSRGIISNHFPDTADLVNLLSKKRTIYAGFDATSDSLQVGNLLVLFALLHFRQEGHRIIVLIGDATAQIGDPSGKTHNRPVIEPGVVKTNAKSMEIEIKRIIHNHEKYFCKNNRKLGEFLIVRNEEWYRQMNVIDFLSKMGRHLRIGDMISKQSVKERLETTGLNFCEFSYQLFQAYDWYHLFTKYGCEFQIGGADQCINTHHGHDLIKKITEKDSYALHVPLVTDEKGTKFGKTESNAVYLNPDKTSPFQLYQFFYRIFDTEINKLVKLYSFRSENEIEQMIQKQMTTKTPHYLQNKLAEEVTLLVHGDDGLSSAERTSQALFKKDPNTLGQLTHAEINDAFQGAPISSLLFDPEQMTILDLAIKSNCFANQKEALDVIQGGGFYINNIKVQSPSQLVTEKHRLPNDITLVRIVRLLIAEAQQNSSMNGLSYEKSPENNGL